jgi:hypothetical protein
LIALLLLLFVSFAVNSRDAHFYGLQQFTLDSMVDADDDENATSLDALIQQLLHPTKCDDWPFMHRFLRYVKPDANCPGEGHQLLELACGIGEAHVLNRSFVFQDRFCVGGAHLSGLDDHSTTIADYYDLRDLLRRHVSFTTESGLTFLLQNGCLHRTTPKKQKLLGANSFVTYGLSNSTRDLKEQRDGVTLVVRNFLGIRDFVERNAYSVCNRFHLDVKSIFPKPSAKIRNAARAILERLLAATQQRDFYSLHVRRGDKASNARFFDGLDRDTRPANIRLRMEPLIPKVFISRCGDKSTDITRVRCVRCAQNATLYLITDESDLNFFAPLTDLWRLYFSKRDFKDIMRQYDIKNSYQLFKVCFLRTVDRYV